MLVGNMPWWLRCGLYPLPGGENLLLRPTDGTENFLKRAGNLYMTRAELKEIAGLDGGRPTQESVVSVYGQLNDTRFRDIFSELPCPFEELVLEQGQIIDFPRMYQHWLTSTGRYAWRCGTCFLFKQHHEVRIIRLVPDPDSSWISTYIHGIGDETIWREKDELQFVLPRIESI